MSGIRKFIGVGLLELMVILFSLAAVGMAAEMAWCLFPDEHAEPFGLAGRFAVAVLRYEQVAQVTSVVSVAIRFGIFVRSPWTSETRWLVWGTWYAAHVLVTISVFFAATYAVIAGTLPHQ